MKQAMAPRAARMSLKVSAQAAASTKAVVPRWAGAALVGAASLAQVSPSLAAEQAASLDVDTTVETVVGVVKSAGDLFKQGLTTVDAGVKILQQGYEAAAPVIDQGVKAATPVISQAAKATVNAVSPVFNSALPAVSDAQQSLQQSLQDPTVGTVVSGAQGAITAATPYANRLFAYLAASDAVTLGEYALGAVALYYLAPSLLGGLGGLFRGYAGEITAAQVLDALSNDAVLVDIRTQKEKEGSGLPDVPSSVSGRCLEVEFAVTEDKKLRNSLRDPTSIEAAVTAMQIASLKRVSKGTKVILIDRYGGSAASVAKELASKGFGKVYTISGGFDGRGGWAQSKLAIKPAATALSAPTGPFGTFGTRKALPAPKA